MRRLADPVLLIVIGLALAVRAAFLFLGGGPVLDADEAIVGLMASHIVEGRALPLYYYGQNYLGALEAWLVAGVFLATGPSVLSLRLVPALFSVLCTGLVYKLSSRVASKRAGFLAALLFAIPPAGLAAWSLKARGGFIELIAIGTAALLATDALVVGAAGAGTAFLLGLLLAFGWWVNQQIVYYAVPLLLHLAWTLPRDREVTETMLPAVAGALAAFLLLQVERPDDATTRMLLGGAIVVVATGAVGLLRSAPIAWMIGPLSLLAALGDDLPGLHGHPAMEWPLLAITSLTFALRLRNRECALLGATLAAFSWWNPATPIYAATALMAPALRVILGRPLARAFAVGTAVGALPFLIGLWERGGRLFEVVQAGSLLEAPSHLAGFITVSLPMLVGARPFWGATDFVPGLSVLTVAVYAICLPLFLRVLPPPRRLLYGSFLLGVPLIFSASAFGWFVSEPRYLLPIYSVLFLVPAVVADRALASGRRLAAAAIVAILLGTHLTGLSNSRIGDHLSVLTETERISPDHTALIAFLERHGIQQVYTDYWIGYRLAFETGEHVRFAPFEQPSTERIAEYGRAVRRYADPAWIFPPTRGAIAARALDKLGIGYERSHASGYTILHSIEKPASHPECTILPKEAFRITASQSPEDIPRLFDDDPTTRWATHAPQQPGQWLEIAFEQPLGLCWLSLGNGDFVTDYPRDLRVTIRSSGDRDRVMIDSEADREVRYWLQGGRFAIDLGGIDATGLRIEQIGTDDWFDWSVVELRLFTRSDVHISNTSVSGEPEGTIRLPVPMSRRIPE